MLALTAWHTSRVEAWVREEPEHERSRVGIAIGMRVVERDAMDRGVAHIVGFGEEADADARLFACALRPDCSTVEADILNSAFGGIV